MKSVNKWNDLIPYGIDMLTGEACGLSYRLLCDVTDKGRNLIKKLFGMPDLSLAAPWNGGSEKEPHTGSIMLTQSMLVPLGVFALLEAGCTEVWLCEGEALIGIEPGDRPDEVKVWREYTKVVRTFSYRGTAGDRNVHVMSGRIE